MTGLLWEVRPDRPDDLRDRGHSYSWFAAGQDANGGSPGVQDGGSCADSACDTGAYAAAVNAQTLCGFDDWRLPSAAELASLVHHGRAAPAIDTEYFPDVPSADALYWTRTPSAKNANAAWSVDFSGGELIAVQKGYPARARLVRAAE